MITGARRRSPKRNIGRGRPRGRGRRSGEELRGQPVAAFRERVVEEVASKE